MEMFVGRAARLVVSNDGEKPLDLMVESGHLAPQRPGPYDIRAFLLRGERLWGDDPDRERQLE